VTAGPIASPIDRGYAICTTPRSGSNFLCSILTSTGVLGRPREYFNGVSMARRNEGYPQDPEGQFGAILERGATPNGVYGVKVFPFQFDRAKETRWAQRLPSLRFISLTRLDVLGQAVSYARATQTKVWSVHDAPQGEPAYDFQTINNTMIRLLQMRMRWSYFFGRHETPVLHLTYEHVVQHPREATAAVAAFMGLGEPAKFDPTWVDIVRQSDALNDEWRARFLAESRDLARFD
jgi:LPS sulfotransferase NodH